MTHFGPLFEWLGRRVLVFFRSLEQLATILPPYGTGQTENEASERKAKPRNRGPGF